MTRRLIAAEAVGLLVSFAAALRGHGDATAVFVEAAFATSCLLVAFHYIGLYEPEARSSARATLTRLPLALALGLGLIAVCPRLFGAAPQPAILIAGGLLAPLVLLACRGVLRIAGRRERVLLLGASPLAVQLIEEWNRSDAPPVLLGVVEDDAYQIGALPLRLKHLGGLSEIGRILHEARPDRIIVTLTARRGRLPVHLLLKARLRGASVEDGADAYERLLGKVAIEAVPPSSLVFSAGFRKSLIQHAVSRGLSVAVAGACLVLLSPLLALVSLLVVLDSAGPAFFFHDRVGARGRRFRLIKFRTMLPARAPTSEWERDNDGRITRVGRLLRRFRIDELPQLVNVLRGEMNLIGPRPHPTSNFDLFSRKIPYYSVRSSVLPGITGWAQVRYGYANGLDEETEKMRYDLYYIKNMSLALDLRVLFETVSVVLLGRDASVSRSRGKVVRFDVRSAALKAATTSRRAIRSESRPWSRGA